MRARNNPRSRIAASVGIFARIWLPSSNLVNVNYYGGILHQETTFGVKPPYVGELQVTINEILTRDASTSEKFYARPRQKRDIAIKRIFIFLARHVFRFVQNVSIGVVLKPTLTPGEGKVVDPSTSLSFPRKFERIWIKAKGGSRPTLHTSRQYMVAAFF